MDHRLGAGHQKHPHPRCRGRFTAGRLGSTDKAVEVRPAASCHPEHGDRVIRFQEAAGYAPGDSFEDERLGTAGYTYEKGL